jgi:ATP-dependent protease HslVU (ClpYQ) peptidase subunit
MTTICWDGKTLASDGMMCTGDTITQEDRVKIFTLDNHEKISIGVPIAFCVAGTLGHKNKIIDWIKSDFKNDFNIDENWGFDGFILTKTSIFKFSSNLTICEIFGPMAIGTGYNFALSAMLMGKDSIEAVRHASKLCLFTNDNITYITRESTEIMREEK